MLHLSTVAAADSSGMAAQVRQHSFDRVSTACRNEKYAECIQTRESIMAHRPTCIRPYTTAQVKRADTLIEHLGSVLV